MKRPTGIIALLLSAFASSWAGAAEAPDMTARIERLGNPAAQLYPDGPGIYARNVWDLHAYQGKLYLGAGNSANTGPARNAGPVPVYVFDPATGQFETSFSVEDEQIDLYYVFNGVLHIPGHDPRESWKLGNFYRLEEGQWVKHRTIPNGIHTYAMTQRGELLLAGLGTRQGAAVGLSRDRGATWRNVLVPGFRVYGLLEMDAGGQEELYAVGMLRTAAAVERFIKASEARLATQPATTAPGTPGTRPQALTRATFIGVSEFDGHAAFHPREDITVEVLLPQTTLENRAVYRIVKPLRFRGQAVFIGARVHNDHQFRPVGLYAAKSLAAGALGVHRLPLPADASVWDLVQHQGTLYALLDAPTAAGAGHRVQVWAAKDLDQWTPVLEFAAPAFARSFELLDGAWYFGLGCEVADPANWTQEELHPATGEIWRVRLDREP